MSIAVLKFGGTSLKDAVAVKSAVNIALRYTGKKIIVLSAAAGVTNDLLKAARLAADGEIEEYNALLNAIKQRHSDICDKMPVTQTAREKVDELCSRLRLYCDGMAMLRECTPRSLDAVAAFGELLTTTIFADYLNSVGQSTELCDARTFMRADGEFTKAKPDLTATEKAVKEHLAVPLESGKIVVTQGFIAANTDGATITLGRGGSDYSAAIIGAAVEAAEIHIWTDVSGVYSADPNRIADAKSLNEITFEEARQLSFYGAKVLHPETILPAIKKNIPVRVLNTFAPDEPGTLIVPTAFTEQPHIRAVTVKNNCFVVSAHSANNGETLAGFHSDFLCKLAAVGMPLLLFSGGESYVFALIEADSFADAESRLTLHLPDAAIEECAVLCACGPGIAAPGAIQADLASEFTGIAINCGAKSVMTATSGLCAYLAVLPRKQGFAALAAVHGSANKK
ncbi:lysine-sensitive aspartokinase 3 [Ignavibacteria bacterium]|nr:aspartate kinase [Bacteroidota bacterium]MCZ2132233.1 aspartate kinase [Bacteroidota bacterium]